MTTKLLGSLVDLTPLVVAETPVAQRLFASLVGEVMCSAEACDHCHQTYDPETLRLLGRPFERLFAASGRTFTFCGWCSTSHSALIIKENLSHG